MRRLYVGCLRCWGLKLYFVWDLRTMTSEIYHNPGLIVLRSNMLIIEHVWDNSAEGEIMLI